MIDILIDGLPGVSIQYALNRSGMCMSEFFVKVLLRDRDAHGIPSYVSVFVAEYSPA